MFFLYCLLSIAVFFSFSSITLSFFFFFFSSRRRHTRLTCDWSSDVCSSDLFGSSADWYWRICRGIDEREVKPDRPYKSVSAERTFDEDLRDPDRLAAELDRIAGYAWARVERAEVIGRTVTLKVKYGDFTIITRSKSFLGPVPDEQTFAAAGQALLA